jgi:hypothetical protein
LRPRFDVARRAKLTDEVIARDVLSAYQLYEQLCQTGLADTSKAFEPNWRGTIGIRPKLRDFFRRSLELGTARYLHGEQSPKQHPS